MNEIEMLQRIDALEREIVALKGQKYDESADTVSSFESWARERDRAEESNREFQRVIEQRIFKG